MKNLLFILILFFFSLPGFCQNKGEYSSGSEKEEIKSAKPTLAKPKTSETFNKDNTNKDNISFNGPELQTIKAQSPKGKSANKEIIFKGPEVQTIKPENGGSKSK